MLIKSSELWRLTQTSSKQRERQISWRLDWRCGSDDVKKRGKIQNTVIHLFVVASREKAGPNSNDKSGSISIFVLYGFPRIWDIKKLMNFLVGCEDDDDDDDGACGTFWGCCSTLLWLSFAIDISSKLALNCCCWSKPMMGWSNILVGDEGIKNVVLVCLWSVKNKNTLSKYSLALWQEQYNWISWVEPSFQDFCNAYVRGTYASRVSD